MNQLTVPGYAMESENFVLTFVNACQEFQSNPYLKFSTDWTELMQLILMILETFPESVKRFQTFAEIQLESWSASRCLIVCGPGKQPPSGGGQIPARHPVEAEVWLSESRQYPEPRGTTKHLSLLLTHGSIMTEIVYDVRRKVRLRSLTELAAAALATDVRYIGEATEWKEAHSWALRRELCDDWTPAYFDRHCTKDLPQVVGEKEPVPLAVSERRDLSDQTDCPYCEKTGFRNVRLHVAKSKECLEQWERDDGHLCQSDDDDDQL